MSQYCETHDRHFLDITTNRKEFSLSKYDGTIAKYRLWSLEVELARKAVRVWKDATGSIVIPTVPETNEEEEILDIHNATLHYIVTTLEGEAKNLIISSKPRTGNDAWKTLTEHQQRKGEPFWSIHC